MEKISKLKIVEVSATVVVYTIYAGVLAASLAPSVFLLANYLPRILLPLSSGVTLAETLLAASTVAVSFYLYLLWGSLVQAVIIRLLSAGITPGRYPAVSVTTLRWLVYSGIYTISIRTILPLIPMTVFLNIYFRIIGCRMGRNVKLNTFMLNDAYLLTIEDDVIIGGDTDISCHLFESGHLILKRIHIGQGTLIGAHSYISPGVTVGRNCVIGLCSYLRSDHVVPDGSVITSLAGIDVRTAREIERKHGARSAGGSANHDFSGKVKMQ